MLPRDVRLETVDRMRPFYPNVGNIYQIESTGRSVGRRFRVRLERRRSLQVAGIGLSGSLNYSYRSGEDDDDFNNPYLPAWGLARLEAQGAVAVPCPVPARCRTEAPVPEGARPRHLRGDGLQLQSSRQLGPAVQHPQRS